MGSLKHELKETVKKELSEHTKKDLSMKSIRKSIDKNKNCMKKLKNEVY